MRILLRLTAVAAFLLLCPLSRSQAEEPKHRLVIQVDQDDPAVMNLALNNATNVIDYYRAKGETVDLDIVTYGPGLTMLRADTSPVKERLAATHEALPQMVFSACHNTLEAMRRAEGKDIPLLPPARIVPAGIARLIELQEQGWSYVKV